MGVSELPFLTIRDLSSLYQSRQVSPVEVTRSVLERIEQIEPLIGAYITIAADTALDAARLAEQEIQRGNIRGPLHGIPISVKDNYATSGIRTTAGSKILSDWIPGEDATCVARLKAAGAIIIGKTNMHEFAYGGTTQNPFYGSTRNPWNRDHIPGGSSGGSGAAVAAHECIASLGSDTGGSIRSPASMCGIVGLKPTYGRLSIAGVIPLAWSLDHAGPMTKTVRDAALMMNVLAGFDPADAGSANMPVPDFTAKLGVSIRGLRIGYFLDDRIGALDDAVRKNTEAALKVLADLGVHLEEVRLPLLEESREVLWTIILGEAAEIHRTWYETRPDDYGEDVRPHIAQGQSLTAFDYIRALQRRRLFITEFRRVFTAYDAIASPALPMVAPRIGQDRITLGGKEESVVSNVIRFFGPWNLSGLPAISIPSGFSDEGLPTGLQVIGKAFDEITVLQIANAYEEVTPWHTKRAPI